MNAAGGIGTTVALMSMLVLVVLKPISARAADAKPGGATAVPAPVTPKTAPTADASRAEAADRFDRGMSLLESGDNAGALAELTRVYVLAPHPQVLFNIGLIHAAMGRPVEAARAFDAVLAAPSTLPAESLRVARRTRDEQVGRVALLRVTTNAPASIEVDGLEAGKTPSDEPLPVAAGRHIISAISAGHLPARREITAAGQTTQALHLDLTPTELRMAHLVVRTALPDVDVMADGQRVGSTPLPSSLALEPGRRIVELRRPGYLPARREVSLDDGATGELNFDLEEDASRPARRGRLVLLASEGDPDVTVDGRPHGAYRQPLTLPAGRHRVRIERAGFLAAERMVAVVADSDVVARVTLVATPELRAAHKERVHGRRIWGWSATLGGAAVAAGAALVVGLNRGPSADARTESQRLSRTPPCDETDLLRFNRDECKAALADADANINRHQNIQTAALVGMGVGLIAAGVGVALLMTAGDAERYDRPARDPDSTTTPRLLGWLSPTGGGGGLTVAGRF